MTLQTFFTVGAITGSVIGTSVIAPQSMLRGGQSMPSQAQKAVKIFMVPKFVTVQGGVYFLHLYFCH